VYLFKLDLGYALRLEKNDKIVRIQKDKFEQNPHKELSRYINESTHYNNIWRICMACSAAVTLLLISVIKEATIQLFPYMFLVIYAIMYSCINWKMTHSTNFILRAVDHACKHLQKGKNKPYHPLVFEA